MTDRTAGSQDGDPGRSGLASWPVAASIPRRLLRLGELQAWSLCCRLLVALLPLARALAILDLFPQRMYRDEREVLFPSDRTVRFAGACLGRSLARSQYLRLRGVPHALVIGATGGVDQFHAHAWIWPYEPAPEGFVELRRIAR